MVVFVNKLVESGF